MKLRSYGVTFSPRQVASLTLIKPFANHSIALLPIAPLRRYSFSSYLMAKDSILHSPKITSGLSKGRRHSLLGRNMHDHFLLSMTTEPICLLLRFPRLGSLRQVLKAGCRWRSLTAACGIGAVNRRRLQ